MTIFDEADEKKYALSVVKRWAHDRKHATRCFDLAVAYARKYASCREIAAVAGMSHQNVNNIVKRMGDPDNSLDMLDIEE